MFGASLYIIVCSARNRLRVRLRRLREPRYLIGAIVGVAYFYFTIFARMWGRNSSARSRGNRPLPPGVSLEALRASGPAVVGMALLVLMALAWLIPSDSGLLDFTEPEVQFLFVAPVSRRQLLMHRLMRSQLGLLFAAIVPALFIPSFSAAWRLRFALASMWVLLVTMKVHFTGISLARASLSIHGADARRRQWGAARADAGRHRDRRRGRGARAHRAAARPSVRRVRSPRRGGDDRPAAHHSVAVHGAGVAVVRRVARALPDVARAGDRRAARERRVGAEERRGVPGSDGAGGGARRAAKKTRKCPSRARVSPTGRSR